MLVDFCTAIRASLAAISTASAASLPSSALELRGASGTNALRRSKYPEGPPAAEGQALMVSRRRGSTKTAVAPPMPSSADRGEDDTDRESEASEYDPQVTIAQLLAPLSVEEFERDFWGKKPYATRIDAETLATLRERFYDGNFAELAASCRKDDNSRHSEEEIGDLRSTLESARQTVCMPFCFAPGAIDIKRSFIDEMGCHGHGTDIEVGVYFSRIGCPPAQWHIDPNHNLTIQILGEKDWRTAAGDVNTLGASRGMQDDPCTYLEQTLAHPNTGRADEGSGGQAATRNLAPGSVLYLPPGHWHSVIPAHGDSFSVDLRVATIGHAKWLSEALFCHSHLQLRKTQPDESKRAAIAPSDLVAGNVAAGFVAAAQEVGAALGGALQMCPPLRAWPFEPHLSDGMMLGGTLSWLVSRGFVLPQPGRTLLRALEGQAHVCVHPMVAVVPKPRDSARLVLGLRATSSLTGAEYLRFNLHCDVALLPPLRRLVCCGSLPLAQMLTSPTAPPLECMKTPVEREAVAAAAAAAVDPAIWQCLQQRGQGQSVAIKGVEDDSNVLVLLSVLLHAGVLVLAPPPALQPAGGGAGVGKEVRNKRPRS